MPFKKEDAELFTLRVDRDLAVFFQGRRREIERFESRRRLLERQVEAGETPSSLMLVYQGAPGCGKTSLVNHLESLHPDVLFVAAEARHLADVDTLISRIREAAVRASALLKTTKRAADIVLGLLRTKELRASTADTIADAATARALVAVVVDEAQTLAPAQQVGLRALHAATLGIPVLPVLAGLSHTATVLRRMPGLSRLADDAVVNMGELSENECIASSRRMLVEFGVDGGASEVDDAARFVAALSHGWPQHLNRAQVALCRALLRVDGKLAAVDSAAVRQESVEAREAYYRGRLDGSVLARRPTLAAHLVRRLDVEQPYDQLDLETMCGEEMRRLGLSEAQGFEPSAYTDAMIERGVLSARDDGAYGVALQSLRTWLLDTYGSPPDRIGSPG